MVEPELDRGRWPKGAVWLGGFMIS